jgi:hypothetical protein
VLHLRTDLLEDAKELGIVNIAGHVRYSHKSEVHASAPVGRKVEIRQSGFGGRMGHHVS